MRKPKTETHSPDSSEKLKGRWITVIFFNLRISKPTSRSLGMRKLIHKFWRHGVGNTAYSAFSIPCTTLILKWRLENPSTRSLQVKIQIGSSALTLTLALSHFKVFVKLIQFILSCNQDWLHTLTLYGNTVSPTFLVLPNLHNFKVWHTGVISHLFFLPKRETRMSCKIRKLCFCPRKLLGNSHPCPHFGTTEHRNLYESLPFISLLEMEFLWNCFFESLSHFMPLQIGALR